MKMYIARAKKGDRLTLHSKSPIWFENVRAWSKQGYITDLPRDAFPEVTFENSPMEVELVLKK
jgi:hypothetical protein